MYLKHNTCEIPFEFSLFSRNVKLFIINLRKSGGLPLAAKFEHVGRKVYPAICGDYFAICGNILANGGAA